MSDPFIGEVRMVGFNFAPRGWMVCDGSSLSIQQNSALFSLLGVTYGGNGTSTFAIPNLQAISPIQAGNGPGLSDYALGETLGTNSVTLQNVELPSHNHVINGFPSFPESSTPTPSSGLGSASSAVYVQPSFAPDYKLSPAAFSAVGGSQPHNNRQPYLGVYFVIALQGIYPQRP